MQGEQAMIRADDRDESFDEQCEREYREERGGFDNLQTDAEVAEFEAWLDGFEEIA